MFSSLNSRASARGLSSGWDIVLCSWARHFTPMEPLSTPVYNSVLVNILLGVTLQWTSILSRGVLLVASASCGNQDKLEPDEPLSSYADSTLPSDFDYSWPLNGSGNFIRDSTVLIWYVEIVLNYLSFSVFISGHIMRTTKYHMLKK